MKIYFITLLFFLSVGVVSAQVDYIPLAPIPQLADTSSDKVTITSFLSGMLPLIIGVAAGLAVIRIVIGGIQYMTTDAWGGKSEAKSTIRNALVGLFLAMSAYTILYAVNPRLLEINITPPPQDVGGVPLNTGSVSRTNERDPDELGCTQSCVEIVSAEMNTRSNACSNIICFAHEFLIYGNPEIGLRGLRGLEVRTPEPEDRLVPWQITKAFPQTETEDLCYKPNSGNTAQAGKCLEISIFNTPAVAVASFIVSLEERFSSRFIGYNLCGGSPGRRASIISAISGIDEGLVSRVESKIRCIDESQTEHAKLRQS